MTDAVRKAAFKLSSQGYHPVPLAYKTKLPPSKDFLDYRIRPEEVNDYFPAGAWNLGVLLGTQVAPECFMVAFDIDLDDDVLISRVIKAVGPGYVAKKGKKGLTLFGISRVPMKSKRMKRTDPETGKKHIAVELLAAGIQTVLPPSIHPDTGKEYEWITRPLHDVPPIKLPIIDPCVVDEIWAAVDKPECNIFGLNTMSWLGVGGGGDTHDSCVEAVATMVGRGWTDIDIHARVDRAKREAVESAGDIYDWPDSERIIQGWVDSARSKGFDQPSKANSKQSKVRTITDYIIGMLGGMNCLWNRDGQLRAYREGHWPVIRKQKILSHVFREFDWSISSDLEAAWNSVVLGAPDWEGHPSRAVCVLNGTVDLMTGELREWNKDDRLIHRLEFEFDPEATSPHYDDLVKAVFRVNGDEDEKWKATAQIRAIETWEEFAAHTLLDDMSFQKVLFLRGVPGSGKSTLLRVLEYMHGGTAHGTFTSASITRLHEERERTSLIGSLVNVSGDEDFLNAISDATLKAITGGDHVSVRYLYQEIIRVQLACRFVISCNELPRTGDTSGALERRMIVLPCDNPIALENQDRNLPWKLKQEMPGVLNRWLPAIRRLYTRERFDPPTTTIRELAEFSADNNTAQQWVQENTVQGRLTLYPNEVHPVSKQMYTDSTLLYADFREWCDRSGHRPISSVSWGKRLTAIGFSSRVQWNIAQNKAMRVRDLKLVKEGDF